MLQRGVSRDVAVVCFGGWEPRAGSLPEAGAVLCHRRALGGLCLLTRLNNEIGAITTHLPAFCVACLLFSLSPLRLL